jgi:hypothetical protein
LPSKPPTKPVVDIEVHDLGTILEIVGASTVGKRWIRRHVVPRGQSSVTCEHHAGHDIVEGLYEAGLTFVNAARPGVVYGTPR